MIELIKSFAPIISIVLFIAICVLTVVFVYTGKPKYWVYCISIVLMSILVLLPKI